MANSKSARKRAEKSEAQRQKNRAERSRLRTAIKNARTAVEAGAEDAGQRVAQAMSVVDTSVRKGVVHRNAAARTKSRLVAALKRGGN